MREHVESGAVIDGFRVGECIHQGGTGSIFRVDPPAGHDPGFPIVMKAPLLGRGQSSLGIDSFEIEKMILPTLGGAHVPRFVAAGDVTATPYIVMERIDGRSLAEVVASAPLPPDDVARIGAALADAVQSVHAQDVIHLDLKPENFMLRPDGTAVLLDFGFARHARYPDLLAEEQQFAAGSAAYVSPEQLQDDRSDPRSDLFALGALLYQLATGSAPFGEPDTLAGMRDRLWREPVPPRALAPQVPPWLQEVILRSLEQSAADRYQTAAHIALDLRNREQVERTARGERIKAPGFFRHTARWWRARRGYHLQAKGIGARPGPAVIMVAVDTEHPDDERHSPLQWTTANIVSLHPEFRLMCVSIIKSAPVGEGSRDIETTTGKHLEHKTRLRHWVEPLRLPASRVSLHVVEAVNAADTLVNLARANHVGLIVLGAPRASRTRLGWWRSAASTVTADAPCSVHVVRVPERR
ncbi:MAG TPA: bifunctional serine/threonine-protein kinase/universal stress protein [Casimicrobiaceae bacterium]|nr:bifunctional serine/threonine-protein kinase/universal stress protein [Casimicrobiaceae bacterium]